MSFSPERASDRDAGFPAGSPPRLRKEWEDTKPGDEDGEAAFKVLSREEAQALKAANPPLSPWRIVAWQALAGVVSVALWGFVTRQGGQAASALWGAVATVVPSALMAWGMTRRPALNAGTAVLSLMVWELIKISLTLAILVAVVWRVEYLSWPALLVTMVVCLKANWLALLRWGRIKN